MEDKIARDDVLRYLCERGGSAKLHEVEEEVGDRELTSRAVGQLRSSGLVEVQGETLKLTEEGWGEGREALRKHRELEEILGDHRIAHALEHLELSREQMQRLVSLGSLKPLSGVGEKREVVVAFPSTHDPRLLARLYGAGLVPGARLLVVGRRLGSVVVSIRGRLVALDEAAAESLMVALG